MLATLVIANILSVLLPDSTGEELFSVRLAITLTLVTPIWLLVTYLTSKEPTEQSIEFYKKMKVSGPGWKKVQKILGLDVDNEELGNSFVSWLSCVFLILSAMLGIGKILFHQWIYALIYLIIVVISGYILKKSMSKMDKFLE